MLSPREQRSLRAAGVDRLLEWHLRYRGSPGDVQDLLDMVSAAVDDAQSAETSLQQWAVAARRYGATWQQIGDAMGTTRQAAQKRFGSLMPADRSPVESNDVRVVVVGIDEEPSVLAAQGRDGFMLSEVGDGSLVFVRAIGAVEHRRVPLLAHGPSDDEYRQDGWEVAARAFPFLYLAHTAPPSTAPPSTASGRERYD